jgi:tetratricopeptide (TPR) repeat protein
MRRKTKWVFAFLAVVFGLTFVFLGVGSGGSALTDILNGNIHLFGTGGGPSIQSLENNVAKHPTDPSARLKLADALKSKSDKDTSQIAPAIAAYQAYLKLKPGDDNALSTLGTLYGSQVTNLRNEIQSPPTPPLSVVNSFSAIDPRSVLATALSSILPTSLSQTSLQQGEVVQLSKQLVSVIKEHVGLYQKLAAKTPNDSSAALEPAQIASQDQAYGLAIQIYQQFLKKFPSDPLVPDVKNQIKSLKKQIAQQQSGSSTGSTG